MHHESLNLSHESWQKVDRLICHLPLMVNMRFSAGITTPRHWVMPLGDRQEESLEVSQYSSKARAEATTVKALALSTATVVENRDLWSIRPMGQYFTTMSIAKLSLCLPLAGSASRYFSQEGMICHIPHDCSSKGTSRAPLIPCSSNSSSNLWHYIKSQISLMSLS